ncbi:hypothetical protein LTR05_008433 [Lithohypha guttulata]|uniref:Uncharacterized protein n=1 Tax=Lithohypha guttulata TaxID=1690604 RepID=A0AAN7SMU9_9EURO|nr:hypothetical protein LTR05_008433 [Lithohypha guttulata]
MVAQLVLLSTAQPNISPDLEADNLGHESFFCLMQIREEHNQHSILVDILVLGGKKASEVKGHKIGETLRTILEDPARQKLIWDVR